MFVKFDEKGQFESIAMVTTLEDIRPNPQGFELLEMKVTNEDFRYLVKRNGIIQIDEEQKEKDYVLAEINKLRFRRASECFPVINRGTPWYNRLTAGQVAELDAWYQSWLDVTETKIVPEKPQWLE